MQMHELDDNALLRQYTEQNSEAAFAVLVARHINKVYSVALRHTRNPRQAVFVILARSVTSKLIGNVKYSRTAAFDPPAGYDYQWSEDRFTT